MKRTISAAILFFFLSAAAFASEPFFLTLPKVEPNRTLLLSVQIGGLSAAEGIAPERLADVELYVENQKIESQYIPGPLPGKGTLIFKAPNASEVEIRLVAADEKRPSLVEQITPQDEIRVERAGFTAVHQKGKEGGFPSQIIFKPSGKSLDGFWNDRLFDRPSYTIARLSVDPNAMIEKIADGPLATVVRSRAFYLFEPDKKTDTDAFAVYDWYYPKDDSGLVLVAGHFTQSRPRAWNERHFLEYHSRESFNAFIGPNGQKPLTANASGVRFEHWGGLSDGTNGMAFFSPVTLCHDGKTPSETYLHADPDYSWGGWSTTQDFHSAAIWLGTLGGDVKAIGEADRSFPRRFFQTRLTVPSLEKRAKSWLDTAAIRLALDGRLSLDGQSLENAASQLDAEKFIPWESDGLGLLFERQTSDDGAVCGLALAAAVDRKTNRVLTDSTPMPLFTLESQSSDSSPNEKQTRSSLGGWKKVERKQNGAETVWRFLPDSSDDFGAVTVRVAPSENSGAAIRYELEKTAGALDVLQLALVCGAEPRLVWPSFSGVVSDLSAVKIQRRSPYPTGFEMTMQWAAVWDESTRRGLYWGMQDPAGATKTFGASAEAPGAAVELSCRIPDADNRFLSNLALVLEPFDGDWFDAARLYKKWVRSAVWYPTLNENGRPDTPDWMKKLSLWALFHHQEKDVAVPALRRFQEAFGVPAGVHWYCWHEIPFDNDYPHYFPVKPGFIESVLELQKSGNIHIMPYINGRLWDTHDKGAEDWLFTKEGLPAATKDASGAPNVETYVSRESDGSPVKLAVCCPTTGVWRDKVRENVLRLMNQCGVDAVYIDQISAAVPKPCYDASHGHPLGQGAWWVPAYLSMLGRIRADMRGEKSDYPPTEPVTAALANRPEMPRDRVLTSECNAEPFMNELDGYLTWHWQADGAVPAFSAVYGGAIQLFGRSYDGDALAWKMKAAEELVFGEQIGWFGPEIIDRPEEFAFIRPLVRFRQNIVDYFYRGEMARPPKFLDPIPSVTGDWRWSGNPTPVTAPSVRAGCWTLNDKSRAILIFSNVAKEAFRSRVAVSLDELGFDPAAAELRRVDSEGKRSEKLPISALNEPFDFPALETWGLEISQ